MDYLFLTSILAFFRYMFLKIYLFLSQSQIYREEEKQRRRSSVWWFTPQVTTMTRPAPIWSQEPGALPGLPRRCKVPRLWAIPDCFPRPQAGSWMEVEQLGLELASVWDLGSIQGEDLSHLRHHARPWYDFLDLFSCLIIFITISDRINQFFVLFLSMFST